MLANIALNSLDWKLHEQGFRFVRYADDFVVLCQSAEQAREAHVLVEGHLTSIGLALSAEKTKETRFSAGFQFLGFQINAWSVMMRDKSVQKFKDRVREVTVRHRNLEAGVVKELNQIIRGVAHYFGPPFATVRNLFRNLDEWLRMRLRCMKFKRKSREDNWRMRVKHLRRMGFVFLCDLLPEPVVETS